MLIRKFDPEQLVDAYDVKEQMFYPWNDVVATPFGSAWLVVEPGRRTKPHNHHEGETFFILRGRGTMTVGDESREVAPGDVVYLPPFGDHILANDSPHEDLHFLTIWWEDAAAVAGLKQKPAGSQPRWQQKVLAVTVCGGAGGSAGLERAANAPDAVDAAGACLSAEIHVRYARLRGVDVRTLLDPTNGPTSDPTGGPTSDPTGGEDAGSEDTRRVLSLFERLHAAGEVELRSQPVPYCETCQRFAAADEPTRDCPSCGRTLSTRSLARLFFAPARHEEAIASHASRAAMSPQVRTLVDAALAGGLAEVAISQLAGSGGKGVRLPVAGLDEQRFDPRFVRAARLLARCEDAAHEDEEPMVVFLGLDQAWFHAVLLPALADAAGVRAYAPATLVDCTDGRAVLSALAAGSIEEVPAEWHHWLHGLELKVARDHQGRAPGTQAWTREQQLFVGKLLRSIEEAAAAYQAATFSPQQAARVLRDLVAAAREFAEREQPWSRLPSRREESNTAIAVELLAAKVLAILAHPLLPDWSRRLWRGLGYTSPLGAAAEGMEGGWEDTPTFVPTGSPIHGLGGAPGTPA